MIGVVLADDHEMVRTGFRMVLEAEGDVRVLGVAGNGEDAVAAVRDLRPDVVLMDIRMPGMNGLDATRLITAGRDAPRVVVVTTFDSDEYLRSAIDAGASGFLLKDAGPRLLVEAVRAAADGDALVSPSITVRLLEGLAGRAAGGGGARGGLSAGGPSGDGPAAAPGSRTPALPDPGLSARELEIVTAIARGRTNEEIAADHFVSLSTVKTHARNISGKLGARNRVEIAAWAWRRGVVR